MPDTRVTYVGHSTVLIESSGGAVLTDPIFSDSIFFIRRHEKAGIDPSHLPKLSAVIISHMHFDHFDDESYNYIRTDVPLIVPEGSGERLTRFFPNPIIELSEWSKHSLSETLTINAVPANHSGGRIMPSFRKKALGYVIEAGSKKIYFAGDTTYDDHFRTIGTTYPIDLALLPISSYRPAFLMKRFHMDPRDAVQAFIDLNAKMMVPIHWGAFRLSLEKIGEPIEWLRQIIIERGIQERIKILNAGESLEV